VINGGFPVGFGRPPKPTSAGIFPYKHSLMDKIITYFTENWEEIENKVT